MVRRVRLAVVLGLLLLAAAVAVPCGPFGDLAAESLPYQDAPPELLQRQADEIARLEAVLDRRLRISGVLLAAGIAALGYAGWCRLRRPRRPPA